MRRRLSYANVVATLALFVALGGSSYAAVKLTGRDIRDASLTGRDVRDGSLSARDLSRSARRAGPKGERGEAGARGEPGPRGEGGAAGAPAVRLWAVVGDRGTLERGQGVRAVQRRSVYTGYAQDANAYAVTFDRDVSGCALSVSTATSRHSNPNDAVPAEGGGGAPPPPYGFTFAEPAGEGKVPESMRPVPDTVHVFTAGPDGKPAPRPFHLLVAC